MTWFDIQPRDVWLFRDGKPFNAGEDNSARSLFPPTPFTVQGALRQQISESLGVSFHAYRKNTTAEAQQASAYIGAFDDQKEQLDTGTFRMEGPFLSVQTGIVVEEATGKKMAKVMPLFPCPADLFVHTDSQSKHYDATMISAPRTTVAASDLDAEYQFLNVEEDYENLPQHWITGKALRDYLQGVSPSADVIVQPEKTRQVSDSKHPANVFDAIDCDKQVFPSDLVYKFENRFGVSTDSTTSFREEGMLYQAQFVRPTDGVGLLVEVDGSHEDSHVTGTITIGGEQRQAAVSKVGVEHFPQSNAQYRGAFKVVFLTPAYFKNGWLPAAPWADFFKTEVELIGAALYRPLRIGGWSSAKKGQRTMHNYVAPGSVYYFRTTGNGTATTPDALTETPTNVKDAAYIGFGQVVCATWDNQ